MGISAKEVAELRKQTGVGMMECKKALEEAGGDMRASLARTSTSMGRWACWWI
jgi:elongation factor Ts